MAKAKNKKLIDTLSAAEENLALAIANFEALERFGVEMILEGRGETHVANAIQALAKAGISECRQGIKNLCAAGARGVTGQSA